MCNLKAATSFLDLPLPPVHVCIIGGYVHVIQKETVGFFVCFFVPVDMQVGLKAEILMDDDKFMFLLTKKQVFIVVFSSSGKLSFSAC